MLTTGATRTNIAALAAAKGAITWRVPNMDKTGISAAEHGIHSELQKADLNEMEIYTVAAYCSGSKCSSMLGLGHDAVMEMGSDNKVWEFNLAKLEAALKEAVKNRTSVVFVVGIERERSGKMPGKGEVRKIRVEGWHG